MEWTLFNISLIQSYSFWSYTTYCIYFYSSIDETKDRSMGMFLLNHDLLKLKVMPNLCLFSALARSAPDIKYSAK